MALARALAVEPKVLLLDEPFGALDARVRTELRRWLRRLHDEVHVTTIFVTHDQEEAMDVAEQIVVMNDGRVEQAGTPTDLYDHPNTEFVMSFVGTANRIGSRLVRPHDVQLAHIATPHSEEAMIDRIVYLGFEVRLRADARRWQPVDRAADPGAGRGARAPGEADRLCASKPGAHFRLQRLQPEYRGDSARLSTASVQMTAGCR